MSIAFEDISMVREGRLRSMDTYAPHQIWQDTLEQLQLQMTNATFNTWLKHTHFVKYVDNTYTIGVKNAYAKDWLENRLLNTIRRTLTRTTGESSVIEFIVTPDTNGANGNTPAMVSNSKNQSDPPNAPQGGHSANNNSFGVSLKLSVNYTFDRFVVGSSNRLAHAASLAVAERPGKAYNPLFLYGGVGLGKTHLLQAIAHKAQITNKQVIYVSSETFTNDFINAIRRQNTEVFRAYYRNTDFLLIDDIQFIAGKESTQEEFFHTFNDIHSAGGQIAITSDRLPKAIPTLEARLSSRFEWGLLADIQPPDLETRLAILRFNADEIGATVSGEVMDFIARRAQSNIRELEGALNKVVAHAALTRDAITLEQTKKALQNLVNRRASITIEMVIDAVAQHYDLTVIELKSPARSKRIAAPRQMAMYLSREETKASLPQIGEALGGRDHTTVMYGYEKINRLVEQNERIRKDAMHIRETLYQQVS